MSKKNISPLRYPGGKSFLINFLSEIIECNKPVETYVEPFAGGAGAALGLLINGKVKNIIINDADKLIYSFWYTLLNKPEYLIKKIKITPINIEIYNELRKQVFRSTSKKEISIYKIGFAVFYVNRCNRSGILRSGPIGGYAQNSEWKIDARFNKKDLIERIVKINRFRDKIKLYNKDAVAFLRDLCLNDELDTNKTIIYLDPPYYEKGPSLYIKYFKDFQHEELRNFLMNGLKSKWVLSYDDVKEINNLYHASTKQGYHKAHFAYKAKVGKELVVFSDNCKIPYNIEKL